MDEAELAAQLRLLLAEELSDRIPDLERTVVALDRVPDDIALRQELNRLVHVVKGASRSAGILDIEAACHALESLLALTPEGAALPGDALAQATALIDQLERKRTEIAQPAAVVTEVPLEARDANVRVGVDELDDLLAWSSGITLSRQRVEEPVRALAELTADLATHRTLSTTQVVQLTRQLAAIQRQLSAGAVAMRASAGGLDTQVRQLRLRSVAEACRGCERIAHDIAASAGKQVQLEVQGGETKIDRAQVEPLREVLIQLVRNAVVHGLQRPEIRRAAGKPERGTIVIAAELDGDAVRISVSDDGDGLDRAAIAEHARRRGILGDDLDRMIFAPGMSTAREVTEDAGRGVGLDIAKQRVEALHGSIGVTTEPGQGTRFAITLPTSVATLAAVLVSARRVAYAVPSSAVERLVRVDLTALRDTEQGAAVRVGDAWLPVAHLDAVLGDRTARAERRLPGLVLRRNQTRSVLLVDQIDATVEIAVGGLGPRIGALRHVSGQSILPSGAVALVLDVTNLIEDICDARSAVRATDSAVKRRVLVADDSATTRALMVNILRTAGYEVISAVDGEDALSKLLAAERIDLVVSDVDMPRRDGFSLAREIRQRERFARLPVILVTARSNDADRAKGLHAGASAYLVKSGFDQTTLLQTISRLL